MENQNQEEAQLIENLLNAIHHLLNQIGDKGTCKGCGRAIWWVKHRNGKRAPYTAEGLNHFADCPQRELFRK
jgi:hypothetical protein